MNTLVLVIFFVLATCVTCCIFFIFSQKKIIARLEEINQLNRAIFTHTKAMWFIWEKQIVLSSKSIEEIINVIGNKNYIAIEDLLKKRSNLCIDMEYDGNIFQIEISYLQKFSMIVWISNCPHIQDKQAPYTELAQIISSSEQDSIPTIAIDPSLLDILFQGVVVFDIHNKKYLYHNSAFSRIYNFIDDIFIRPLKMSELIDILHNNRSFSEHPDFIAHKKDILKANRFEEVHYLADDKVIKTTFYQSGNYHIMLAEDVSYITNDNRTLRVKLDTLQKTYDCLQEGVVIFNSNHHLEFFNETFARIWNIKSNVNNVHILDLFDLMQTKNFGNFILLLSEGKTFKRIMKNQCGLEWEATYTPIGNGAYAILYERFHNNTILEVVNQFAIHIRSPLFFVQSLEYREYSNNQLCNIHNKMLTFAEVMIMYLSIIANKFTLSMYEFEMSDLLKNFCKTTCSGVLYGDELRLTQCIDLLLSVVLNKNHTIVSTTNIGQTTMLMMESDTIMLDLYAKQVLFIAEYICNMHCYTLSIQDRGIAISFIKRI